MWQLLKGLFITAADLFMLEKNRNQEQASAEECDW